MAWLTRGKTTGCQGSTNVTALTFTGSPPVYSSGGIPGGAVVTLDTADGTDNAVKVAGATDLPLGVSVTYPAAGPGDPVAIQIDGEVKVLANAATVTGVQVSVAATGQVAAAATGAATSVKIVGISREAAAQAGDLITVLLQPGATTAVAS